MTSNVCQILECQKDVYLSWIEGHASYPRKQQKSVLIKYKEISKVFHPIESNICFACNFHTTPFSDFTHEHDYFEIVYVLKGQVLHQISTQLFTMKEGDICIIYPYAAHSLLSDREDNAIINILLPKQTADEIRPLFDFLRVFKETHSDFPGFLMTSLFLFNEFAKIDFHRLLIEYFQRRTDREQIIPHLISLIRIEVQRGISHSDHLAALPAMDTTAAKIIDYIKKRMSNATIDSVSETFHYHPTYITQLLKKTTGRSFADLKTYFTILQAKHLLTSGSASVEEIAEQLGYQNTQSFSRAFKNKTGMSPSVYRKNYTI